MSRRRAASFHDKSTMAPSTNSAFRPARSRTAGPGGIHISLSTISPATARRLAEHQTKHEVEYVAFPVFRQPEAAAAEKLWVCTSGHSAAKVGCARSRSDRPGHVRFRRRCWRGQHRELSGNLMILGHRDDFRIARARRKKRHRQRCRRRSFRQDALRLPRLPGLRQVDRRRKVRAGRIPAGARLKDVSGARSGHRELGAAADRKPAARPLSRRHRKRPQRLDSTAIALGVAGEPASSAGANRSRPVSQSDGTQGDDPMKACLLHPPAPVGPIPSNSPTRPSRSRARAKSCCA